MSYAHKVQCNNPKNCHECLSNVTIGSAFSVRKSQNWLKTPDNLRELTIDGVNDKLMISTPEYIYSEEQVSKNAPVSKTAIRK
jgi:hypothetical protein